MNVVLLIIFIAIFTGNKRDRKKSDLFRLIFGGYIALTVLSAFVSSPVIWLAAIALIIYVASKRKKDKEDSNQKADYEAMKRRWEQQKNQSRQQSGSSSQRVNQQTSYGQRKTYEQKRTSGQQTAYSRQTSWEQSAGNSYRETYTASRILPRQINKRGRIVSSFNHKYDLSLTQQEIDRIVDASYVSESWKREVEAMTMRYDTEAQWFSGPTDWLRVYIYVFELQNISSDFSLQEQICFETLDEVMAYACEIPDMTVDERIARINERYFTRFDEMTFMIVYRFLQRKGRNYDLSRPDLVKNVDRELEETMKKYRTAAH